jgi:hypothetical protein
MGCTPEDQVRGTAEEADGSLALLLSVTQDRQFDLEGPTGIRQYRAQEKDHGHRNALPEGARRR